MDYTKVLALVLSIILSVAAIGFLLPDLISEPSPASFSKLSLPGLILIMGLWWLRRELTDKDGERAETNRGEENLSRPC